MKRGSPSGPKHQQIATQLRDAILKGSYAEGARLPSETELVERHGVSRPTVGRALRDLQREGLVERRVGSGTFVRRRAAAKGGLWGLIIPGLGNTEIFEPICAELAQRAQRHGFSLLWGSAAGEGLTPAAQALQLCAQCLERRVAGAFFAPLELTDAREEINARIVAELKDAGIPLVLLDRDLYEFPRRSAHDLVGIDNTAAAYVLTEHLLQQGSRRPVFVARPLSAATVEQRILGFRGALAAHGIASVEKRVSLGDPADPEFARGLVRQADACVCANDHTAALLMHTFEALGVHVPRDVRIAGFDDTRYAKLLAVPLTTMHQPCREIGAVAVRAMLERCQAPDLPPRQILLEAALVVRSSCGAR
jgi:GntR family transcriptional regulator, arabinose operon transcriptional repressor